MAKDIVKAPALKKVAPKKIATPKVSKTNTVSEEKVVAPKATASKGLKADVYSLTAAATDSMALPETIFGAKINIGLIDQALRVYLNNSKSHWANTKTRGKVEGSTRKIYRQKGTGNARHGSIRAPIFVGGGIALGPTSRQVRLTLPQKMKKVALVSALSSKAQDNQVGVVADFAKATGKTKQMVSFLKKINKPGSLFVLEPALDMATRALRNISDVTLIPVENINAFEIIKHQNIIFTKESISALEERLK